MLTELVFFLCELDQVIISPWLTCGWPWIHPGITSCTCCQVELLAFSAACWKIPRRCARGEPLFSCTDLR